MSALLSSDSVILEMSDRLARMETKMDAAIKDREDLEERTDRNDERIGALERFRSGAYAIAAVLTGGIIPLISIFWKDLAS